MISDILSQVVVDLDHYLTDPDLDRTDAGQMRERIIRLRDEVENIRSALHALAVEDQEKAALSRWIDWMLSDESARAMRTPVFSQSDLRKRGWTKRLINELLGRRDFEAPNPHGPFAPMLCWYQSRVFAAEETPAFKQRRSRKRG